MFPEYLKILDGYDILYSFSSDRLEYISKFMYHRMYMKPSENGSFFNVFASLQPSCVSLKNHIEGGDYDRKCHVFGQILSKNFELADTVSVRVFGKGCITSFSHPIKFSELDDF